MSTSETYSPLPQVKLSPLTTYASPLRSRFKRVRLDSPAVEVMTDLHLVHAITVDPAADITFVEQRMIAAGVRLLLVVDRERHIIGLITASDVMGEKPIQFAQRHNVRVEDVTVFDLMIPQDQLDVLRLVDVTAAAVGDVVETLKQHGRQHALVIEESSALSVQQVRGIFSATQISRQLGVLISPALTATSFAELEAALISSSKSKVLPEASRF